MPKKKIHMGSEALISERRRILLEIIMNDPRKEWSARKMEAAARRHPWFQEHQPRYGKSTAYLDYAAIMEDIDVRKKGMADGYIRVQLDDTNIMLSVLMSDWEFLQEQKTELMADRDMPAFAKAEAFESIMKMQEKLVNATEKLRTRQASLMPIEVPKKLEVEQTHTLALEDYIALRDRGNHQLEAGGKPDVIEGEFTDD